MLYTYLKQEALMLAVAYRMHIIIPMICRNPGGEYVLQRILARPSPPSPCVEDFGKKLEMLISSCSEPQKRTCLVCPALHRQLLVVCTQTSLAPEAPGTHPRQVRAQPRLPNPLPCCRRGAGFAAEYYTQPQDEQDDCFGR